MNPKNKFWWFAGASLGLAFVAVGVIIMLMWTGGRRFTSSDAEIVKMVPWSYNAGDGGKTIHIVGC